MTRHKEITVLFITAFLLVILSWSKLILTGSMKVDDNPFSTWEGAAVVAIFACGLILYGVYYFRLYQKADGLPISHNQIKIWGYLHILLASVMLPLLSNDIFLYIAYGELSNSGIDVFTQSNILPQSKWIHLVGNWKESPYLYGPLTLWISKIANWAGGNNIFLVLTIFKLIWMIMGIGFLEIISLMVKNSADFILVLFTPIFWLQNIAGVHFDLMAAFFLLISVYFISQQKIVFSLIAISIACMCKIVFVIFIPFVLLHYFFINPNRITWKPLIYFTMGLVLFAGVLILSYLPFWKGMETISVPMRFLNTQEPSKSFSEVLGEICNGLFGSDKLNNTSDSASKIRWWNQFRIGFNLLGIALGILVSIIFMSKTKFVFYKNVLAEYWIKICLVFFFFYSHIFNAWYLIALLPFIPLIGNNQRLKKYITIVSVFSCLHMIFLNIAKDSFVYYLIFPVIFINISLFLWQFKKNFLTVESLAYQKNGD